MSQSRNPKRNRLAVSTETRQNRFGLIGSLALHAAVIAGMLFTFQHHFEIPSESPPVVPVELVTIADKTNIKEVSPEPFKPKQAEPIKAEPVEEPKQAPQEMSAPSVPMKLEAPKVEQPPPPEISEPAPDVKMAPPPPPKVQPKQRPTPPKPEKQKSAKTQKKFDVNNILALLDKEKPKEQTAKGRTGAHPTKGVGAQNAMTVDLKDALFNQIRQCWNPPVGAPHPDQLVVTFEVFLNPDGSVARPPQLTAQSQSSGPFIRAAIDAARRAIYVCAPYKLPANRYDQWRDIEFEFNPKAMMGGG